MRRREFLGATALLPGLSPLLARLARAEAPPAFARFEPIEPSDADHLVLPEGFRYDVVIKWGDPFTASGDLFGYNNDFIGAFALKDEEEALLVVNHEYISLAYGGCALYPETFRALRGRNPTVDDYKDDVGFTQPDNLRFDARGDLWVTTDISRGQRGRGLQDLSQQRPVPDFGGSEGGRVSHPVRLDALRGRAYGPGLGTR